MSYIVDFDNYRVLRSWDLPDPNPMPFVTVSPRLERALARWDDTRRRVRVAVAVLRHGCEYEDHLDCGDRW